MSADIDKRAKQVNRHKQENMGKEDRGRDQISEKTREEEEGGEEEEEEEEEGTQEGKDRQDNNMKMRGRMLLLMFFSW